MIIDPSDADTSVALSWTPRSLLRPPDTTTADAFERHRTLQRKTLRNDDGLARETRPDARQNERLRVLCARLLSAVWTRRGDCADDDDNDDDGTRGDSSARRIPNDRNIIIMITIYIKEKKISRTRVRVTRSFY